MIGLLHQYGFNLWQVRLGLFFVWFPSPAFPIRQRITLLNYYNTKCFKVYLQPRWNLWWESQVHTVHPGLERHLYGITGQESRRENLDNGDNVVKLNSEAVWASRKKMQEAAELSSSAIYARVTRK